MFFAEVVKKGTDDLFFEHGFGTDSQSLTERGLPRSNDGLRLHQNSSLNLNIRFSAHAPGNGCVLAGKLIHDAKTRPIEIRMAAQFRSSLAKLRKKQMRRGCRLPIRADERLATCANLSRSGADNTRVLANEDDPHGRIKRLKGVFASKLAIGKEGGLALLAMKIKYRLQRGVRGGSKVEHQRRSAYIVDDDAYGGPGFAPPVGTSLAIDAMHCGNCAKTERGERLASVESMAVTSAFGSKIRKKNLSAWFSQDNAYCILQESPCGREIPACDPFQ